MEMLITIDKKANIPMHLQISEALIQKINKGDLVASNKLPPERDLAQTLNVSRGTIKKAYENLIQKGYAKAEQGNGTFVKWETVTDDTAVKHDIDRVLDTMHAMGFTNEEIESMFYVRLHNKIYHGSKVLIAVIDCNIESLNIIKHRLSYLDDAELTVFLFSDVLRYHHAVHLFEDFDFIITTTKHSEDLRNILKPLKEKIVEFVMSPDRDTIARIAGTQGNENIGIITESFRFREIVNSNLKLLHLDLAEENFIMLDELEDAKFENFINNKEILILPPFFSIHFSQRIGNELLKFSYAGGRVITFNYTIQRGSIIHIEEKIKEIERGAGR